MPKAGRWPDVFFLSPQPTFTHVALLCATFVSYDALMVPPACAKRTWRRSIHPTAWKGNSANFVLTEFSEVRSKGELLLYRRLSATSKPFAPSLLANHQDRAVGVADH